MFDKVTAHWSGSSTAMGKQGFPFADGNRLILGLESNTESLPV